MSKLDALLSVEEKKLLRKQRFPRWVDPMKATLTKDYFSDPEWVFEPKLDGIRCLAFRSDDRFAMLSRNQLDLTGRFPTVAKMLHSQSAALVLDGEIAAVGKGGRTSFGLLQQTRKQEVPLLYFVFDVMHVDGFDLRRLPLMTRKRVLSKVVNWKDPLHLVEHVEEEGLAFYEATCRRGLEGVIAKRASSTYEGARSRDWLKFKCSNEQEFVIGGFTDPQGSREGFGALLVGFYDNGELHFAGKVGTGYNRALLKDLRARLDRLEQKDPPFIDPSTRRKGVHWVKPKLVAQVGFAEWTGDHRLRHPRFIGLRQDKDPRDVVREKP